MGLKQIRRTISERNKQLWKTPGSRTTRNIVVLVLVLLAGINIGNGRFSLPSGGVVSSNLPSSLDYTTVNSVYQALKENYNGKLTEGQLISGLKHGLADAANDPYTTYFTPQEASSFKSELNNTFSGIGAELGKSPDGYVQIIAPIAGTPADKAGLKAQDIIVSIDGKSTAGMVTDNAVKAIRGKAGTSVTLQIVRGNKDPQSFTIMRDNIQLPSVTTKTLDNNIGYIQISSFADDTPKLINEAASKFHDQKVKGIVLDLRNNPGGDVDSAVAVSSQWLPIDATIMQEKRGTTVLQNYQSTGTDQLGDIPTVVLINSGSASASEITAAALHDNKKAYLIGEKSYGKGVVQRIVDFKDGSELKVTIASWYRPDGKNINHLGITPDQKVTMSDSDAAASNDTQLKAAQDYLNK